MKKFGVIAVTGLILLIAGCVASQSFDSLIGTGRIDMSKRTWDHFQKYKKQPDSGAFVYNRRARYAYFNYCPESQCAFSDRVRDAIFGCEENSGEGCQLLAQNGRIVWRGPIYVAGSKVHNGSGSYTPNSTTSAITLPAKYRFVSASTPGEWRNGTIEIREEGQTNVFSASFAKSIRCEGEFLGAKHFATSTKYFTSMRGECRFGKVTGAFSVFTGSLSVTAKHTGQISGKDGQTRKTEIVFQARR